MKTTIFVLAAMLASAVAGAHEYNAGPIEIDHPWARATPRGAKVAGAYFKLINTGTTADRLVGGSSEVGGRFEIHEMTMDNGVMRMRPLRDGLDLKPGESVELKPGSYHAMIFDLKRPLQQGERIKGTLVFEKAGTVEVEYVVVAIGGTSAASSTQHQH
jgi:periplasmic copper chaperone A